MDNSLIKKWHQYSFPDMIETMTDLTNKLGKLE